MKSSPDILPNTEMLFDKDTPALGRSRYYGDLMDVQLLEKSVDYEKLPEQVTIFILSYDPFGKGSMYYEARTMLITHPDTAYNDGVRRIFLYADGRLPDESTEDDRKIQKLLKYIARSTDDNISDESTVELDRIVRNTKVSNPHFKWRFNGNRSAVLYLFRQRRGFAIPFLVPVAPVRGYGSIPPFYHSLPVLLYILVWFPHSHFLPYSRSSLWPISVSLPI